jgi:hypothetical protein
MSEYSIIKHNKHIIIAFGGMISQFGLIPPFEFLQYLSSLYTTQCDLYFFKDLYQCWYHKGFYNITNNIEESVTYLNDIIKKGNYDKVILMGVSSGGYAAILFGSLCINVTHVISFVPQTILHNPIHSEYSNLRDKLSSSVMYIIYGDISIMNINHRHHISHCENIESHSNVTVIKNENNSNVKMLRDNGTIKKIIDDIIL